MTTIARTRIGWQSWTWIVWRQHRLALIVTAAFTIAMTLYLAISPADGGLGFVWDVYILWWKPYTPVILSSMIAAFWAAPLISRERDDRTHIICWSQDVTPRQWLTGKLLVLAVPAVVMTVVLGIAVRVMINDFGMTRFTAAYFESNLLLAITYTLFGMALGVALCALCQVSLLAVGSTFIAFIALRLIFATTVRPYLIPPIQTVLSWKNVAPGVDVEVHSPAGSLEVGRGYVDSAGAPMSPPDGTTMTCGSGLNGDQVKCLQGKGISGRYVEYQPLDRIPVLQFIEIVVYLLLTAGLVWIALRKVSRRNRI